MEYYMSSNMADLFIRSSAPARNLAVADVVPRLSPAFIRNRNGVQSSPTPKMTPRNVYQPKHLDVEHRRVVARSRKYRP